MTSPPNFGRRGLIGAPSLGGAPQPPAPPRRLRSSMVAVGAIGAVAVALAASSGHREDPCRQPEKPVAKDGAAATTPPETALRDERPEVCREGSRSHSRSYHSSSGHGGWGLFSGGGGSSHTSFGGFGSHGSGHGGG